MNYKLISLLAFAITLFAFPQNTEAAGQYGCQSQYGGCGGPSQFLSINKVVKNPETGSFVDNLSINDPKYAPENTVTFQLTVTNIGQEVIKNITVKDLLPKNVTFVSGPGSYDSKTNTLSLVLEKLDSQEAKTYTITGKIDKADKLPSDQGTVCLVNKAQAIMNSTKGGKDFVESEDSSQFCVEKSVLPAETKGGLKVFPAPKVKSTPPTGPEALALIPLLGSGIAGLILRKRSV